jgi:predicted ATPase
MSSSAFKDAFRQLLAPKELLDPEAKQQQLYYTYEGEQFPISSLSSGEREVINIVFDFLLRNPSDSIVIFDEPELHLHPELSYT